jgi:beta-N-acetylhexosaminidase
MDLSDFSPAQIAGQRLMTGFKGTLLDDDLRFIIEKIKAGGVILFKRNISSFEQIRDLCFSIQEYAKSCGQPPLFIAIDQEGGKVARLGHPWTIFKGNPAMKNKDDAAYFAETTANELASIGINMNFAPVMDIATKDGNSIMKDRAFGHDPSWVSELGTTVIDHLQLNNIMAVAKHFPGIGRTLLDSHIDRPIFNADLNDLMSFDLIPFKAAISHDVAGIMLSHILYAKLDPKWPASLSYEIAKKILREMMAFDGLVITDDLDMGAIKKHDNIETAILQILLSGIDIALICHQSPDIENAFNILLDNINKDLYKEGSINCVKRILTYKQKYIKI